jgi:hypothetical protein
MSASLINDGGGAGTSSERKGGGPKGAHTHIDDFKGHMQPGMDQGRDRSQASRRSSWLPVIAGGALPHPFPSLQQTTTQQRQDTPFPREREIPDKQKSPPGQ